MKTKKLIYIGVLVSQALVLYIFESMIPMPFITPGAKLGLANLIVVIGLYTLDNYKECLWLIFLKLILSTIIMGSVSTFIFGLGGTILSFLGMILTKNILKEKVSAIGVSTVGGVFHNLVQLIVTAIVIKNIGILSYLPFLSIAGIGTGIFIGITANYLLKHMKALNNLDYHRNMAN